MAANISCPRVLATENCQEVVVVFPKPLRTRFVEFLLPCGHSIWLGFIACFALLAGCIGLLVLIGLFTWWIPLIITTYCHIEPGIELRNFNIHDMTAFRNMSSTPDSPWHVNTHYNATFTTRNRNTVTKCFTTYRRMDVRVEYHGQVVLQQQLPLGFSLKPHASHNFSIEMKGDHVQLKKDLGPVMQAEMRSGNITLNFFFDTRYLRADRKSEWATNGCVVIANSSSDSSHSKTMVDQDCYSF